MLNMKLSRLLTASCLCLLGAVGGCVIPNAKTYYRPSVEGGRVIAVHGDPVESQVEFSVGTLPVIVTSTIRHSNRRLVASLILKPLPGQTIHFTSDHFQIHDTEHGLNMPVVSVLAFERKGSTSPTIPYKIQVRPLAARALQFLFIDIHVADTQPASFELLSPSIMIDGVETTFPVIHFQRKTWVGISPFNY